jgi:integrase
MTSALAKKRSATPPTRITKRIVDAAEVQGARYQIWDAELIGFGLRVEASGRKSFIIRYRAEGGGRNAPQRLVTIGAYGVMTPDQARTEAKKLLGAAATGADPGAERRSKRQDLTVAELCDLYLREGCPTKKASTLATDRGRIKNHIKPLIGTKRISSVTRGDVQWVMRQVAEGRTKADVKTRPRGRSIVDGGKGTATRTIGLLGGIFTFAIREGMLEDNPARMVKRWKDRTLERYLNQEELERLGKALCDAEAAGENPKAIAIIRLLALTGARKGEITNLIWAEVDFDKGMLRLRDSKTGQKIIPIGKSALAILAAQPRMANSALVFPADKLGRAGAERTYFQGINAIWYRVRAKANLPGVRLHDLRHTAASIAVANGASLPMIARVLGHSDTKTTQRYAHLSDAPVRQVVENLADQVAAAMRVTSQKP